MLEFVARLALGYVCGYWGLYWTYQLLIVLIPAPVV